MEKPGVREIQRAVGKGEFATLDSYFEHGLSVAYTTEVEDWNLLHLALASLVRKPEIEVVQYLIGKGVDVNARDGIGCIPLHYSVRARHIASAQALLETGSDVHVTNLDGFTPLRWADHGRGRSLEMMELLLQHGANPDQCTDRVVSTRDYADVMPSPFKEQVLDLLEKYSQA